MAWRYVQEGQFFPGVPARDLSDEEMDAAEQAQPGVKASGVYQQERVARPGRPAAEPEPAPAEPGA